MANFAFRKARLRSFEAALDIRTGLKMLLVMTNTLVPTNPGIEFLGDLTTGQLDENDGAGYTVGGVALTAINWAEDLATGKVKLTAGTVDYGTPSAGSRAVKAAILYKLVTNYADSPVIGWIDSVEGGPIFPYVLDGGPFRLIWPTSGIFTF